MPGIYAITIRQGETFDPVLTWKHDGSPVNLTGFTGRMQVRLSSTSDAVLLDLSTANGKMTLGGVAGTIALLLTAGETAALTWRRAVYDLELVSSGGQVTRLLEGPANVSPEVTR